MRKWLCAGVWVWVWLVAASPQAGAQAAFPTQFPQGAEAVEPEALQKMLTGQVFNLVYADGTRVRVEYTGTYAYLNVGNAQDKGKWRVEGTQVCVDWGRFPPGCFEVRQAAGALYAKRAVNGEIVLMGKS